MTSYARGPYNDFLHMGVQRGIHLCQTIAPIAIYRCFGLFRNMWTDEQLTEQGWTQEQIKTRRIEQVSEAAANVESIAPTLPVMPVASNEMELTSSNGIPPVLSAILLGAMLLIVPFSLYSISNAEGTQGPAGTDGLSGVNGTAGSSFHLVETSSALPNCDETIDSQIFFIAAEASFQVCQANTWSAIDLVGQNGSNGNSGADGNNGTDGQNGADGQDGTGGQSGSDGSNGADGSNGNNGLTSLIVTSIEPSGINCPNGGTLVESGVDDNGDNSLSVSEVDSMVFVCKGDSGQDGADGSDGTNGSSTASMMVARLSIAPAYLGCNGTGQLLQQGMDNGAGNGIALNGVLEAGEIISSALICTTFEVTLVADINTAGSSNPSDFVTINSTMYFIASNGSASGIWSLDANDTLSLVYNGAAMELHGIGNQLMFLGSGLEPWVYNLSNGTAWQVADIFPGTSGSFAADFTLIGTTVFFSARDSAAAFDLWAYETGNFSVWKVEDGIQPSELMVVNSQLYFATPDELWKHDTTNNSTFVVKDINPGVLSSSPSNLVVMGTRIYLAANDGSGGGIELQAYETTNNSTWQAADIRPGFATSSPSDLAVLNTRVYMKATSGTHFELWVYESTNNSFWEVSDIQSSSGSGGPSGLTVHDYTVYFTANDGTTGQELWAHNSINGTTWQVIDLNPTPSTGFIGDMYVHEGNLYFSAQDNLVGTELWRLIFSKDVSFV